MVRPRRVASAPRPRSGPPRGGVAWSGDGMANGDVGSRSTARACREWSGTGASPPPSGPGLLILEGVPPRSPYDDLVHPRTVKKPSPQVQAQRDLVVEDPSSGFVGAVVRCEKDVVHLEDRFGKVRAYPLGPGFWVDGRPVVLVRPRQKDRKS